MKAFRLAFIDSILFVFSFLVRACVRAQSLSRVRLFMTPWTVAC